MSQSNPAPVRPGTVTTADGPAGSSILRPLSPWHIEAIEARGLDPELLEKHGVGASDRLPGDRVGIPFFEQGVRAKGAAQRCRSLHNNYFKGTLEPRGELPAQR